MNSQNTDSGTLVRDSSGNVLVETPTDDEATEFINNYMDSREYYLNIKELTKNNQYIIYRIYRTAKDINNNYMYYIQGKGFKYTAQSEATILDGKTSSKIMNRFTKKIKDEYIYHAVKLR